MSDYHSHDEDHNHSPKSQNHNTLIKLLIAVVGIVGLLVIALLIGVAVLFVHFINVPSTSIVQALTEAWQAAINWAAPIADLYNQTINLLSSSQN